MIPNFAEYELNLDSESKPIARTAIRSTIGYSSGGM